jgi:hypothetical protein
VGGILDPLHNPSPLPRRYQLMSFVGRNKNMEKVYNEKTKGGKASY